MNYTFIKNAVLTVAAAGMLAGCGSGFTIVSPPIENIDSTPIKTTELSEYEKNNWKDLDLQKDTIPGMSVNKAYDEILKGRMGQTTIVAVIDSGIDVEHEDLDGVIWTNPGEIAGNGKDDDNNGYIDDVHGWNFLGNVEKENLEYERIVRDKAKLPAAMVTKAQKEYDEKVASAQKEKQFYEQQLQTIKEAQKTLEAHLGKKDFSLDEVKAITTEDEALLQAKQIGIQIISNYEGFENVKGLITDEINNTVDLLNGESLKKDYRQQHMPGNNPYAWEPNKAYGNNQYAGPDKEGAAHGTHVAGIIAAERNNGIGINGVANNVKIMVLRAVPDGDEYDKDVAMAIRYAADNGAKVINTSFGKYHSTNPEWVWDAIKYAESKDVLIVNAAGNEATDTDFTQVYPQDQEGTGAEKANNFLTVGAIAPTYGSDMVANFSNYGKSSVDIFAPGVQIYSTTPNNEYKHFGGTSMASPAAAGVAAMVRSQYPKLSAAQVKQILMDSGLTTQARVNVGGATKAFQEATRSGKMVNLYNALIMASKM